MEPHREVQRVLFTPERIQVLPHRGSPEQRGSNRPYTEAYMHMNVCNNRKQRAMAGVRNHRKCGTFVTLKGDRSYAFQIICKKY